jgi:VCBS repeat-containing protein
MNRIFSFLTALAVAAAGLAGGQRLAGQTPASVVLLNLPIYQQTAASVETLSQDTVVYDVTFVPGAASAATTVQISGPAGAVTLAPQPDGSYQASQSFATAAAASAGFPNGTYTVTVGGGTPSTTTVTVANGANVAPVLITNYTALQAILKWTIPAATSCLAPSRATSD